MTQEQVEQKIVEERREYFRKWRAANKDKTRKHREDYWRRRAEKKLREQEEERNDDAHD